MGAVLREVTRKGLFPSDNTGPGRSLGETPGAGTIYSVALTERVNMAQTRNQGPTRGMSRSGASLDIPMVHMGSRATGRIGG